MDSAGAENRIQGLSLLKPVSLLKAYVAGRGYSLWPEDLSMVGNTALIEASLVEPDADAPSVAYTLTPLRPGCAMLAFRLRWPQKLLVHDPAELHFWHAVLCNTPQSEADILILSDLGLSLLKYYETNYTEIGETLAHIAQTSTHTNPLGWSERFFQLPQQVPPSLNVQARALLADVRNAVNLDAFTPRPPTPTPLTFAKTPLAQRMLSAAGWILSAVLFVLLLVVLRA